MSTSVNTSVNNRKYKLVIVGNGNTGKTTFISQHRGAGFPTRYNPTMGVEVHPIVIPTDKDPVTFTCWDCAGIDKFRGLGDGYYIQGKMAMVFCRLNDTQTIYDIPKHVNEIKRLLEKAPIIIVATHLDKAEDKLIKLVKAMSEASGLGLCMISNKNGGPSLLDPFTKLLDLV